MQVEFPFRVNGYGLVGTTDDASHIYQMIEQVLFTMPGERVNRPDFGCGIPQMVFEPESGEMVTVTQILIQGSLQQWLGDVLQVDSVDVQADEMVLKITIQYRTLQTQQRQVAYFER